MGFRRNPRRVIGLTLPFLPRDPRISFPARTEAQGLLRYSLPRSMLSNFLYNLPLNIHFFDFRFTPRKRLRKNPLLFHVATLSSAQRKSRPKLKLGPDVLHSIVIEVMGLACHVTTSLICIYVSNLSPHETIRPKNLTLSDLAHFWSVDSSGPDESNDTKTSLICPSCAKLRAVKDLGPENDQNSTLSDLAQFWPADSSGPDESNDAKTSLICPSCS